MSVTRWYRNLAPRTRILLGAGVMAYAGAGMILSDRVEERLGWVPSDKDQEDLKRAMPRISTVERDTRTDV